MIKKFSKSKILALVTTGAIVVSTAFSFAAWHTLTVTNISNEVSWEKPVAVASTTKASFTKTSADLTEAATAPEYTSDSIDFSVNNLRAEDIGAKLTFAGTVKIDGTADTSNFDIVYYAATDTTFATPITELSVANDGTYSVVAKVTPKESANQITGNKMVVEVEATLGK